MFPGSHDALCHYSKCGGVRVEELPNISDLCSRGYRTVSGLSQHKRHMHPEVRVQERMMVRGPRGPVGRGRTVWSEEEEEVVIEFGINHGFIGVYAPLIAARIPGRSLKQIREKVRTLRRTGRLPHVNFEEEAARFEEEFDAPPSSLSEASEVHTGTSGDESEASSEREAAELEVGGWERNPREEWLQSEPRNPLSEEFKGEWEGVSKPSAAWLDGFVKKVTDAFLNADPRVADHRRVARRARAGRAGAKRRRYADTQELFKDIRPA